MKEIILSKNKVAIIDDEDYAKVSLYNWYAVEGKNTYYACRTENNNKKININLANFILNNYNSIIDHIDGNGLNNQKNNLRIATNQQNCMNVPPKHLNKTSKYKGIFKTKSGTYEIQFKYNYKSYSLGRLSDEELAAKYYDAVARFYHGEFAWCNFKEIYIIPNSIENLKQEIKQLNTKKIIQTDINGNILNQFENIKQAYTFLKISQSYLYKILSSETNIEKISNTIIKYES